MRTTSRGFDIAYTVAGAGPPLVLLTATLCSAADWQRFGYVEALASSWTVVAIDPLGHGESDGPHDPRTYAPDGVVDDIVAVLDAEGVDTATVWGYSRGGWLACRLAATHPDRVERLVVGGFAMAAHEAEPDRFLRPLAAFLARGDWDGLWTALGMEDSPLRSIVEAQNDPVAVAAAIEGSLTPTRYVDPRAIRCPAIYYVGSEDWRREYVPADASRLRATVETVEGHDHVSTFAAAAHVVLAAVMARLRGGAPDGP